MFDMKSENPAKRPRCRLSKNTFYILKHNACADNITRRFRVGPQYHVISNKVINESEIKRSSQHLLSTRICYSLNCWVLFVRLFFYLLLWRLKEWIKYIFFEWSTCMYICRQEIRKKTDHIMLRLKGWLSFHNAYFYCQLWIIQQFSLTRC